MMTSLNGNIIRVTGPLWGESTGHQWIPLTKAGDPGLCCRVAGNLRHHRAHYDATVIFQSHSSSSSDVDFRLDMQPKAFSFRKTRQSDIQ